MKKLVMLLVAVCLLSGCEVEPVAQSEYEIAVEACQDLQAAHLSMALRCGITPPAPAGSTNIKWHYTDCSTVTAVEDVNALYNICLPALASGCYQGDTPDAIQCHQLVY